MIECFISGLFIHQQELLLQLKAFISSEIIGSVQRGGLDPDQNVVFSLQLGRFWASRSANHYGLHFRSVRESEETALLVSLGETTSRSFADMKLICS
jgi:hypothetical protein